jgi:pimeloyl-ACP methyl ester carboxylesterase
MALSGEQTHNVQLDIRYARSGGAAIAYQVVGNGPTDLVFVPEFMSNLVYGWEVRHWREFYEKLASFSRLILFDKRGTGLSDYGGGFPTLETRMEDVRRPGRRRLAQDGCAGCAGGLRDGVLIRGDVSRANESARPLPTGVEGHRRRAR